MTRFIPPPVTQEAKEFEERQIMKERYQQLSQQLVEALRYMANEIETNKDLPDPDDGDVSFLEEVQKKFDVVRKEYYGTTSLSREEAKLFYSGKLARRMAGT